jgi:hypothetical protein
MKKDKKRLLPKQEPIEWDLSEDFGILPKDIPLTQNIGCVGSSSKKRNPKN